MKDRTGIKTIISTNIKDYFPGFLKVIYTLFKEKKEGDRVTVQKGDYRLLDLLPQYFDEPVDDPGVDVDDPACFLYTGGTTGLSKGAVLTHRNLAVNAIQIFHWMPDAEEGKEIGIALIPFFHSFGLSTCLNLSLLFCGSLVLIPHFDLQMVLRAIDREKPTLFPAVPTIYIAIINAPDLQKYDLSSLKICISGAAPLPAEVQSKFGKLTGSKLAEGYGLTETSPVTHANPIYGKQKVGSIGLPFPNTEARIVDMEDPSIEMPVDEEGQLAIRGPQVMKGYLNRPEETTEIFHDGWLLTGDIARMDEEGYFYIIDRKKDMIIAGGLNIFPREIEEVLYMHEKVKEACVVGVPHEYRGETVKAFIVPRDNETLTEAEIKEFCEKNLAKYKTPKSFEFRDELPKTLVGKVLRRKLLEEELSKQRQAKE
ncbi:MAG: long-chain fatty acid--CoA ligase [Dethiobacteria bacterium]